MYNFNGIFWFGLQKIFLIYKSIPKASGVFLSMVSRQSAANWGSSNNLACGKNKNINNFINADSKSPKNQLHTWSITC